MYIFILSGISFAISSKAIELTEDCDMTPIGFLKSDGGNVNFGSVSVIFKI